MNEPLSVKETLESVISQVTAEWVQLQIVGRALTAEELRRSEVLSAVLNYLRKALSTTEDPGGASHGSPNGPGLFDGDTATTPLEDGGYRGGNADLTVELRLDTSGSGVISADFFRRHTGGETWVVSLRTPSGTTVSLSQGAWDIVAEDQQGQITAGHLKLSTESPEPLSVVGVLRLDNALAGIPAQQDVTFTAERRSEALRALGIELEHQQGVAELPTFDFDGQQVTVGSCLADAGFETFEVGQRTEIPDPPTPWGTAQLHGLMSDHAQATLAIPEWELHLLLLARSSREGLLGVMFDTTATLPRQGSAVFAEEIRDVTTASHFPRKLIQTTVHELGHALNLAHRFERVLGRADSTSFMNYDWRYRGGGRRDEFWSRFDFTFDRDELEFLRHGPRSAVIPGGRAFHSVSYWAEGNGGYQPYYPEVPITDLTLTLTAPPGGTVFEFLQPVFLQVELTNNTGQSMEMPDWFLDPKQGVLQIVVRRVSGGNEAAEPRLWVPMMQRCYDVVPQTADFVPDGGSISRNLNLTFGAGGFAFAEPGEYEIQAVLSFPNSNLQREFIVPSNSLRVRIGYPRSREEEEDALVILRDDVGTYFALGGSRVLEYARQKLEGIKDRRQGRAKKIKDPIVANIVRCAGIDAGRAYLRFKNGKFVVEKGDRERAAELLEQLDEEALRAFDSDTAASTKRLATKHRKAVDGGKPRSEARKKD